MATLLIPEPVWATPAGWFSHAADVLEGCTDAQLVENYRRLTCASMIAANAGVHQPDLVAGRRWAEWVIGVRLGPGVTCDGKPINPGPAFAELTRNEREVCREMGGLDGDVLHDHLRRATTIGEMSRSACLRFVDVEVGA